jgi:site-specific recombinase XerD
MRGGGGRMPYGYVKYLENKGYKRHTINTYMKTINAFLHFINVTYKCAKEPYEISSADIRKFLDYKIHQEGNTIETANKHLTILKNFFDYLWQIDKIAVDPTVKIKRLKGNTVKITQVTYEDLLHLKPKIIRNSDYPLVRKAIYILSLKGLRSSEFHFKKDDVQEQENEVIIHLKKHTISLTGEDAEVFMSYFFESQFNSTEYVFVTKKHDHRLVPIEFMSILSHLRQISRDYRLPVNLNLNEIRHYYAYYLYVKKRMAIQQIALLLGIQEASASQLIKESLERHKRKIS